MEQVAHLDHIGRLHLRIGDGVFVAHNGGKARQQRRIREDGHHNDGHVVNQPVLPVSRGAMFLGFHHRIGLQQEIRREMPKAQNQKYFARIHPRFRTPHITTIWTGVAVGGVAMLTDIGSLADLTNIGTLFAFVLVCLGVIVLRRTQANRPRPFRVPLVPLFPILGVIFCFILMLSLPLETWGRFIGWLVIGLIIYGCYGFWRSKLRGGVDTGITEDQPPPLIKP